MQPRFEVADIARGLIRDHKLTGLHAAQMKVITAITRCRTAALGGHAKCCLDCGAMEASYNSCRNRHCPKCQGAAAAAWMEARQADLLPTPYYHVVFTLPGALADIALQNKRAVYGALFKAASETLTTIGRDPNHLGGQIGATLVLHTWGSSMTHHPHIHAIVAGGALISGKSADGGSWTPCRDGFYLPVRVLSSLFRRLMCERLAALFDRGALRFHGKLGELSNWQAFAHLIDAARRRDWVVYAKRPFAGPEQVLAYLARYTHRVAISNSRITRYDGERVAFRVKDYRKSGKQRYTAMTLEAETFLRRFLLHVLPHGFHRIRHIGFMANTARKKNIAAIRKLMGVTSSSPPDNDKTPDEGESEPTICPYCGGTMVLHALIARPRYALHNDKSTARAPPEEAFA